MIIYFVKILSPSPLWLLIQHSLRQTENTQVKLYRTKVFLLAFSSLMTDALPPWCCISTLHRAKNKWKTFHVLKFQRLLMICSQFKKLSKCNSYNQLHLSVLTQLFTSHLTNPHWRTVFYVSQNSYNGSSDQSYNWSKQNYLTGFCRNPFGNREVLPTPTPLVNFLVKSTT